MWTQEGLERIGRLVKRSYLIHYRNNWSQFSRAAGGVYNHTISRMANSPGDPPPRPDTLIQVAPHVEIPFMGSSKDFYSGGPQAFSSTEFIAVATGILEPRVDYEEPEPRLKKAVLAQAEAENLSIEDIADASGIQLERLKRILVLGGWPDAGPKNMVEIIKLGSWLGDLNDLAKVMGITPDEEGVPANNTKNGSQSLG